MSEIQKIGDLNVYKIKIKGLKCLKKIEIRGRFGDQLIH